MRKLILTVSLCVLFVTGTAMADWNEGDYAKWVQLPDLRDPIAGETPAGVDVSTYPDTILADDFLCTSTDPITGVHIWGSWIDDVLPMKEIWVDDPAGGPPIIDFLLDPASLSFRLSIHSDIPVDAAQGIEYSRPGELLWEQIFDPGQFTVRPYGDVPQGWYDPATGEYLPDNHTGVWQYNFDIDHEEAFIQQGTDTEPIVYWLDVETLIHDEFEEAEFGWKTSIQHWNDDGVYSDGEGGWNELIYPDGHPQEGESIDLAFVIVPEPTTMLIFGLGSLMVLRKKRNK